MTFDSQRARRSIGNMENSNRTILVLLCSVHLSGKHLLFVAAINYFLSITAILGNAVILIALHKESSLHPPSKLLCSCLAVTDLLAGIISQPVVAFYFTLMGIAEDNLIGFCVYSARIAVFTFTVLAAVSMLTMTAISVDRLLALLLGLRYRHVVTLKRVRALVLCFWIASTAFTGVMIMKFVILKAFVYALNSLCLLVSVCCYSKIVFALRHHQAAIQDQVHQEQPNGEIAQNMRQYRKTVSTAMWILLTLVVCYLPYSIVLAMVTAVGSSRYLHAIWTSTVTLVCLNSSLNPIVYCWKIKAVRQEVKNTIKHTLCFTN